MPEHDQHTEEEGTAYLDAETLFESYLDRDSGAWSIRRISAAPPADDGMTGEMAGEGAADATHAQVLAAPVE